MQNSLTKAICLFFRLASKVQRDRQEISENKQDINRLETEGPSLGFEPFLSQHESESGFQVDTFLPYDDSENKNSRLTNIRGSKRISSESKQRDNYDENSTGVDHDPISRVRDNDNESCDKSRMDTPKMQTGKLASLMSSTKDSVNAVPETPVVVLDKLDVNKLDSQSSQRVKEQLELLTPKKDNKTEEKAQTAQKKSPRKTFSLESKTDTENKSPAKLRDIGESLAAVIADADVQDENEDLPVPQEEDVNKKPKKKNDKLSRRRRKDKRGEIQEQETVVNTDTTVVRESGAQLETAIRELASTAIQNTIISPKAEAFTENNNHQKKRGKNRSGSLNGSQRSNEGFPGDVENTMAYDLQSSGEAHKSNTTHSSLGKHSPKLNDKGMQELEEKTPSVRKSKKKSGTKLSDSSDSEFEEEIVQRKARRTLDLQSSGNKKKTGKNQIVSDDEDENIGSYIILDDNTESRKNVSTVIKAKSSEVKLEESKLSSSPRSNRKIKKKVCNGESSDSEEECPPKRRSSRTARGLGSLLTPSKPKRGIIQKGVSLRSSPQTPGPKQKRPSELEVPLTPSQSVTQSPITRARSARDTPSPRELRAEKRRLSQQTQGSQKKEESILISDEETSERELAVVEGTPQMVTIAQHNERGKDSEHKSSSQRKPREKPTESSATNRLSEYQHEDVIVDTSVDNKQTRGSLKVKQSPQVSHHLTSQDTEPVKTSSQPRARTRKSFSLTPGSELNSEEMIGDTPQEKHAKVTQWASVAGVHEDSDDEEVPPTPPQIGKTLNTTYTVSPKKASPTPSSRKFKKPLISRLPKIIGTRRTSSTSSHPSSSEQDSESLLAQNANSNRGSTGQKREINSTLDVGALQDNAEDSGNGKCL